MEDKEYLKKNMFLFILILISIILIKFTFGKELVMDNKLLTSSIENIHVLDMNKVDSRVDFKIRAKCDKVLTNPRSYICYSYENKGPLFNIYTLDDRVNQGNAKKRLNFIEDKRLIAKYRSNRDCFKDTGDDLGHLKPDADADWSKSSLKYTYLMSNVVPQPANINRHIVSQWEKFERDSTLLGVTIVITGTDYYKRRYLDKDNKCTKLTKDFYKAIFAKNHNGRYYPIVLFVAYRRGEKVKQYTNPGEIYRFLLRRNLYIFK